MCRYLAAMIQYKITLMTADVFVTLCTGQPGGSTVCSIYMYSYAEPLQLCCYLFIVFFITPCVFLCALCTCVLLSRIVSLHSCGKHLKNSVLFSLLYWLAVTLCHVCLWHTHFVCKMQ